MYSPTVKSKNEVTDRRTIPFYEEPLSGRWRGWVSGTLFRVVRDESGISEQPGPQTPLKKSLSLWRKKKVF